MNQERGSGLLRMTRPLVIKPMCKIQWYRRVKELQVDCYGKASSTCPDVLNAHIGLAGNSTVSLPSSVGPIQFSDSLTYK